MDDDAWCALFGEVRGVVDEWAVFSPVETADGTLWRGLRAWPWRPGDEAWLLLRDGRWEGLRPVSGVPVSTFIEALEGRPVPEELVVDLMYGQGRRGEPAWTFIGFDGHVWSGVEPISEQDHPYTVRSKSWELFRNRPTDDAGVLTELLAGLWPDEAREAAVRREELEVLPSTMLRRWTTVDILSDRARTGADRRTRHTLSLLPPRSLNYKSGALWAAYRQLFSPRWLDGPKWPWKPRRANRSG